MQQEELFRIALGLEAPWTVSGVSFSEEKGRLDIRLDFPAGSRWPCPDCGQGSCAVHDTEERTWRHLNFFQHETYLHARQPRVECERHGVKTVAVPWARKGMGFTLLMEAFIVVLAQHGMTPRQIARLMKTHDTRIWRVLGYYVEKARKEADHSAVRRVGVDETSRARGHQYISVFMDLEPARRRVLYVCEGRDAGTIQSFVKDLEEHGGAAKRIKEACLDMSPAYQKGLAEHLPDAELTFDQFHLMKLMNEAVDEVRRQEQKDRPELKKTRYVWLKNPWNHTAEQAGHFERLRDRRLKTARAYQLKTVFQDVFLPENGPEAEAALQGWYNWAIRSRLAPMVEAARTIRRHWQGVLNWFDSQISNGVLESINSLIQSAKAKARGFRSVRYLTTMIYLIAGRLEFRLPAFAYAATHTK